MDKEKTEIVAVMNTIGFIGTSFDNLPCIGSIVNRNISKNPMMIEIANHNAFTKMTMTLFLSMP
jgi:hypothetical protein